MAMETTFINDVTNNLEILGITWIIPTALLVILVIAITRDPNQMKTIAFPLALSMQIVGVNMGYLTLIITAMIFAINTFNLQLIGELVQTVGTAIGGVTKGIGKASVAGVKGGVKGTGGILDKTFSISRQRDIKKQARKGTDAHLAGLMTEYELQQIYNRKFGQPTPKQAKELERLHFLKKKKLERKKKLKADEEKELAKIEKKLGVTEIPNQYLTDSEIKSVFGRKKRMKPEMDIGIRKPSQREYDKRATERRPFILAGHGVDTTKPNKEWSFGGVSTAIRKLREEGKLIEGNNPKQTKEKSKDAMWQEIRETASRLRRRLTTNEVNNIRKKYE